MNPFGTAFIAASSPVQPSSHQAFIRPPRNYLLSYPPHQGNKLNMINYSASWINLLSPDLGVTAPKQIDPPRSGAVSFSSKDKLFVFGGYAEVSSGANTPSDRLVVNDLWEFLPYNDASSEWGWLKLDQKRDTDVPGPRLATAMAAFPSTSQSVLLGGWDPQVPGTGGVILDDVSVLDVNTLQWSQPTAIDQEDKPISIPGGPTSRHVAVPICNEEGDAILLHNHRCDDHVLLLSLSNSGKANDQVNKLLGKWTQQPTIGDVPSSRGLHCAAQLYAPSSITTGVVVFGGAAKDGNMSNEAFMLNTSTWKWTKLICSEGDKPSPRAGACLCALNNDTVLLFGGAERGETGLVGLNDVWILSIDSKNGTGVWKCLIQNSANGDSKVAPCPPRRNAATLTRINAPSLLPNSVVKSDGAYYLLQGGWDPFRITYNDCFILHISWETGTQ